MANNKELDAYTAGFEAGFRYGKNYVENTIMYMKELLECGIVDVAGNAFEEYSKEKQPGFEECCQSKDKEFSGWARENLGWDLDTDVIPSGIAKSISPMRAFWEGQAFYTNEKGQEKKIYREDIQALIDDMKTIRESGLFPVLQDFTTKNVKIEDKEGHVYVWWQKSGSLCLMRGIYEPTGQYMYFKGDTLLPKKEQGNGGKCHVRAEGIAEHIEKMHDTICELWKSVKLAG